MTALGERFHLNLEAVGTWSNGFPRYVNIILQGVWGMDTCVRCGAVPEGVELSSLSLSIDVINLIGSGIFAGRRDVG